MKKVILIIMLIILSGFIALSPKPVENSNIIELQDESNVEDIPFDTKAIFDSITKNN